MTSSPIWTNRSTDIGEIRIGPALSSRGFHEATPVCAAPRTIDVYAPGSRLGQEDSASSGASFIGQISDHPRCVFITSQALSSSDEEFQSTSYNSSTGGQHDAHMETVSDGPMPRRRLVSFIPVN